LGRYRFFEEPTELSQIFQTEAGIPVHARSPIKKIHAAPNLNYNLISSKEAVMRQIAYSDEIGHLFRRMPDSVPMFAGQ
jgi:hypothetical protein